MTNPQRMTLDQYISSLPVGTEDDAFARERRQQEGMAIRSLLPAFLRAPTREQLEARVHQSDFLSAVLGWRWGHGNLLLLGPTGSGKSSACALLYRLLLAFGVRHGGEAWERARFMAWFGAADLLEASRRHPLGKGEAPDIQQACRARLLFLDDVGLDSDPTVCSLVLDERYQQAQPTIISSGRTEAELERHYGAAFARRMTEAGGPRGGVMARFPAAGVA